MAGLTTSHRTPDDDLNYLIVKVELEDLPEEEEEDDDDSSDQGDYWPIGLSVYALGGIVFCGLYKWAEHSVVSRHDALLPTGRSPLVGFG